MASIFSHAVAGIALGKVLQNKYATWKYWLLGIICSMLPDADVALFRFGVKYGDFWGHRGFTHSLVFALLLGILIRALFFQKTPWLTFGGITLTAYFFLCTASHGLLDMLTNGGKGVAIFSPFDNVRYFLPWRPIQVSPLSIARFFGERGVQVIKSELVWIWLPSVMLFLIAIIIRKMIPKREK